MSTATKSKTKAPLTLEAVIEQLELYKSTCREDLKLEDGADSTYWELRGELHAIRKALSLLTKLQTEQNRSKA